MPGTITTESRTHNEMRRVRAGEVCDSVDSAWEAKAWKTKYVIQQYHHTMDV